jgi:RNA-binding protein YhbY
MSKTSQKSQSKSKSSKSAEQQRHRALADRAYAILTRNNTVATGSSAVTPHMIKNVLAFLKSRDILKFLSISEKNLKSFANHDTTISSLSPQTREALKKIAPLDRPNKKSIWPVKAASILLAIHEERRRNARKRTPKQQSTTEPQSTPES